MDRRQWKEDQRSLEEGLGTCTKDEGLLEIKNYGNAFWEKHRTHHVRMSRPMRAALYKFKNWLIPVVMTCSATPSPGMIAANGRSLIK